MPDFDSERETSEWAEEGCIRLGVRLNDDGSVTFTVIDVSRDGPGKPVAEATLARYRLVRVVEFLNRPAPTPPDFPEPSPPGRISLAQAKAEKRCRVCGDPVFDPQGRLAACSVVLWFGREFAHMGCLTAPAPPQDRR